MYMCIHEETDFTHEILKKENDLLRLDNLHPQNGACRQKSTILNSVTKKKRETRTTRKMKVL